MIVRGQRVEVALEVTTGAGWVEPAGCRFVRLEQSRAVTDDHLVRKVADAGVTVVLVEHDMKMVMNLSDRILVLDYGKKLAEGDRDAIRRNPEVIAAYLGAHA